MRSIFVNDNNKLTLAIKKKYKAICSYRIYMYDTAQLKCASNVNVPQ